MSATQAGLSSLPEPSTSSVDEFTRLYNAHLRQATSMTARNEDAVGRHDALNHTQEHDSNDNIDATAALEAFRASIPAAQQPYLDKIAQRLRAEFHAEQARGRQARLHGLLQQMPPFRLSEADYRVRATAKARLQRRNEMRRFVRVYARRDNVGVHPFFSALRQVLEAQALDRQGKRLQWALDDAVLMECGGDDFMQAAVRMLKGVLHFEEHEASTMNPFLGGHEQADAEKGTDSGAAQDATALRIWTVPSHLTNPECRDLARIVPVGIVVVGSHRTRRAASSASRPASSSSISGATRGGALVTSTQLAQLYASSADTEQQLDDGIPLSTGRLCLASTGGALSQTTSGTADTCVRDIGFQGGWVEWLLGCVSTLFRKR